MRKIRQHNDIDIVVKLKNDEGVDATLIKEYKVFLTQVGYRLRIEDYQILPDGRIGFRFHAANQRVGVYSIVVTAVTTDDRVFTTDVCNAFALVRCSCDAEDGSSDAEIEALEVNATFEITAWGGTAESDPIFTASPAAKITEEDIEGWKAQGTELGKLAKVARSGSYNDLSGKPVIPTESTVGGWGFTKNPGTVTGVKMNGQTKGTSGIVDLGPVITDVSEYAKTVDVARDYATKVEVQGLLGDINTILVDIING